MSCKWSKNLTTSLNNQWKTAGPEPWEALEKTKQEYGEGYRKIDFPAIIHYYRGKQVETERKFGKQVEIDAKKITFTQYLRNVRSSGSP